MWRKGSPSPLLMGTEIGVATEENSMEVPQKKLKIEIPYDPAIPCWGIYPKKMKTLIRKDICTPTFIAVLFTIAKIWKQSKCPSTNERIKICFINGILVTEKNEILPFATTWMDLEGIMLTETLDKDKYCLLPLIMGNLKNKINE